MNSRSKIIAAIALVTLNATGFAAEAPTPSITVAPNKTVCAPENFSLGEDSVDASLCVTQGNFSSDKYVLQFNGTAVIQGIDDETTPGIAGLYKDKKILLQCGPQSLAGNATAEEVRKVLPSYSDARVNALVALMKSSIMGVEVGRLCTIKEGRKIVMQAQVFFE